MALYQIETPDGKLFQIEGPEGASHDELIAQVQQYQRPSASDRLAELRRKQREARRTPVPEPEVETTFGGNVKETFKGLVPGAIGLVETAGTGIASLLPEDTEKAAREKIKEIAGIAKKPFEASKGYEESVGRKLGEGLGSTLPFFAMGPLGVAGRIAGTGLGVAAGAGEARESAEAKGATGEERRMATLLGAPTGLLDILAPQIGPMKSLITTALARGGVEGATEAAQKIAQNLIAKGVYDPNQPVLAGSGEEGAYGAGVGALASLIIDLTVGRKARRAHLGLDKEKTPAPTETSAAPAAPTAERPQGELFPTELETAQRELESIMGPQRPAAEQPAPAERTATEAGQMSLFKGESGPSELETTQPDLLGDLLPAREEATAEKVEEPIPERDTETRDMIDELETSDAERMVEEDKSAELRKLMEQDKAKAKKERLKLESDIAELDGQIKAKEEKTSQDKRLELLLPIVESDVGNIPKLFVRALKKEGFTNTNLTEREQKLIDRAYGIRLAETPVVAGEEIVAQPEGQAKELEAQVPEKKAQREPEQPSFPGMGKAKGKAPEAFSEEETAAQEEKPFATVLTPEVLAKTGLPKQSGFYKQLLNMDMADTAQQPTIANIFAKVRQNPNLSTATKDAIENIAMQAFGGLATQGEMFGPRGKVLEPTAPKEKKVEPKATKEQPSEPAAKRDQVAGTDKGTTGTRPEGGKPVVSKPAAAERPAGAKSTEKSEPTRLGDSGQPVRDAGVREGTQPRALKETKTTHRVTYDGKPATVTIIRTAEDPTKIEAVTIKVDGEKFAAVNLGKQGVVSDEKMLDNLVETEAIESKSESKPSGQSASTQDQTKQARRNYLEWAGNRATAVRFLAGDVFVAYGGLDVEDQNRMLSQLANGEIPKPVFGAPTKQGTGGVYAKRFFESLTAEEKAAYADELEEWLRRNAGTAMVMADMNAYQNRIRAEEQQFSDEELDKLSKDLTAFSTPLNTEALRHIQNGDVLSALAAVGKMGLGRASQIARGLAGFITNTHIEIADFSSADAPKLIKELIAAGKLKPTDSGFFTTRKSDGRRLIMLNSKNGLDVWSLLHEATHAAMHDTLNNPNHPITKQLKKLFEGVKAQIEGTYGAEDLGEFLSEARSNPEFQKLLNGITPDGKPISAWRRYLNIIGNLARRMFRMEQKAANTSVLSTVDALIDSVIAGKGGAAVSLDSIAMLNKGAAFMDGLADRAAKLPYMNQRRVGKIMNILEGVLPDGVKNIVLGGLPLNALTDVAKGRIPMAERFNVLDQQKSGADNRRHEQLEPVVKFANEWQSKNPKSVEKFNRVVYTSTRFRVDPSKDRSKYLNSNGKPKFDTSGNNLAEVWDSLQADWRSLKDNGGQDLYRQMRDSYKRQYEDMKNVLLNRIDGMETDEGTKKTLKDKFLEKLFEGGTIEPYFPLTRKGDYWLSYDANGEHYVEAFESDYERRKAIEQLGKKASNISMFSKPEQLRYRELPPTTFVGSVLQALEASKVHRDVVDRFMEQFINILPETSFMKNLRHREGTLGFEQDAIGAFRSKAYGLAHQVTNIEYGQKFSALQSEINKYVKSQGGSATDTLLLDELNRRFKFAMSPNIPKWSKVATSVGFNMTLGLNVSSAMVNMAQIPLVVMPYLGGKYGLSETTRAIGRASRYFLGSGSSRMIERVVPGPKGEKKVKVKAFPSLDNYDFSAKDAPKHLEALSEYAKDHGQLNRSMMYDILDVGDADSVLSKINAVTGFVFHHSERMNRQVSMIAAYELELQRLVGDGRDFTKASKEQQQAAAKYAVETTELTNGAVAATAAPRFAQSGIGKVVFMYKRYGAAMYYLMAKTARDALGSKPEGVSQKEWDIVQAAAKRQLAGIFASSALLAGAQGLPMYGIVATIYNLILKATGNDDEDDFDTAAQKYLGSGIHSGAINALTGTEWASRISLSDLLFRDTMTKPNQGILASMLEQFGGPMVGIVNRWERGYKLINDGYAARGMEQMLPSAVGNILKGIRLADEGAKTVRGDTVVEDLGAFPIMAQFFGFAPAEYIRQLDINAAGKRIESAAKEKKSRALKQYYVAMRNGDSDGMADAWEQISEYNQKHPTAAITMDSLKRSIRSHERTSMEMYHGVSFDKRLRAEILQNLSEFEED